jgi:hypothetical protein
MKRYFRFFALVCMLGSVALAGCALTEGFEYSGTSSTTEVVPAEGIEVVEFRLGSDDLEVVSKEDTEIVLIIKKTWKANDREYGEGLLDEVEITIERDGEKLVVERKEDLITDTWDMMTKGYVSVDIIATIPPGLELDIETGSGDVDLGDRDGVVTVSTGSGDVLAGEISQDFEMETGSGDLQIGMVNGLCKFSSGSGDFTGKGVRGQVEISTGSGDVDVDMVTGSVKVSTGSGDVGVGRLEGSLHVKTGSGDLVVHDHDGEAEIETSSGDVRLRSNSAKGLIDVDTSSGDVDITLYNTESVAVDLGTSSGVIRTKIPLVVEEAVRSRLLGRAGAGDLKIDVSTASGDINIKQGSI